MVNQPDQKTQDSQTKYGRAQGWIRCLGYADKIIGRTEAFILSWGILLMAGNTIANVLGRYVFHRSIYFSEELNEFLIIIVTFMGLGYATRKGIHIRISVIYDMLPMRFRKILMIIIAASTSVMMAVLAYYAFEYVVRVAVRGRVTPALQLPLYLSYIWVIVGFVLASIQYLLTGLRNLNFSEKAVFISYAEIESYEDVQKFHPPSSSQAPSSSSQNSTASSENTKEPEQ